MTKYFSYGSYLSARFFAQVVFLLLYFFVSVSRVYLTPFELVSDINQYFNHYYAGEGVLIFGTELVVPVLFELSRALGLGFYDFVFVYSLLYFIPILMLSKYIRVVYLPLYFLFFIIWFIPSNVFLLRQYVAFYFMVLLFCLRLPINKQFFLYLLLAVLSHLSAVFFLMLGSLTIKRRSKYLLLSMISVVAFVLQISFFDWQEVILKALSWMLELNLGADAKRKIIGQIASIKVDELVGISSVSNSAVICLSVILHSIKIYVHGEDNKLLRIFFFTSVISLVFASIVVFSNRLGFVGYFFSIPYLCLVLSHFRFTNSYAIKIDKNFLPADKAVL